ncbi:MAG TPA: tyrosine-type recombinase/integrase [Mycobacterium sp.]|nr:tyrosine-type recombinase/integrase [Mycobacterium sp.]HUH70813.1 tyrosine-type recombinase/integrase [Mycobacterium sp.]
MPPRAGSRWDGSRRSAPRSLGRSPRTLGVVHRGQPLGRRHLFEDAFETACTSAGLVDANSKPTVTAHRFRHTVGTQLAEGGARIQTIMAILGHRSAGMAVAYSHISDPVLKEQYERVIANGGRVAGPAAEALLNNQIGQETLDWLKSNYSKTELELGHCLRLPAEGPCECDLYLRCSKFFTTREYAPRLRERLARQRELQDATELIAVVIIPADRRPRPNPGAALKPWASTPPDRAPDSHPARTHTGQRRRAYESAINDHMINHQLSGCTGGKTDAPGAAHQGSALGDPRAPSPTRRLPMIILEAMRCGV